MNLLLNMALCNAFFQHHTLIHYFLNFTKINCLCEWAWIKWTGYIIWQKIYHYQWLSPSTNTLNVKKHKKRASPLKNEKALLSLIGTFRKNFKWEGKCQWLVEDIGRQLPDHVRHHVLHWWVKCHLLNFDCNKPCRFWISINETLSTWFGFDLLHFILR